MKSELSFLLDLVLDEELPKPLKTKLVARIRDVEKNCGFSPPPTSTKAPKNQIQPDIVAKQSPSMQRIMEANPDLVPKMPQPVTAAAANALASRAALLATVGKEKPEPGRSGPRKC